MKKQVEHKNSDFLIDQKNNLGGELMPQDINFLSIKKVKIASLITAVKEIESVMCDAIAEKTGNGAFNSDNFASIHQKPAEKIENEEGEETSLLSVKVLIQVMQKALELVQELDEGSCVESEHREKILKSLRSVALIVEGVEKSTFAVAPIEMQETSPIVQSVVAQHVQTIIETIVGETQGIGNALRENIDEKNSEISMEAVQKTWQVLDSAVKNIISTETELKKAIGAAEKVAPTAQNTNAPAAATSKEGNLGDDDISSTAKELQVQEPVVKNEQNSEGEESAYNLHSHSGQISNEGGREGNNHNELIPKPETEEVAAGKTDEIQEEAIQDSEVSETCSQSQTAAETKNGVSITENSAINLTESPHLLVPKTDVQDTALVSTTAARVKDKALSGHEPESDFDGTTNTEIRKERQPAVKIGTVDCSATKKDEYGVSSQESENGINVSNDVSIDAARNFTAAEIASSIPNQPLNKNAAQKILNSVHTERSASSATAYKHNVEIIDDANPISMQNDLRQIEKVKRIFYLCQTLRAISTVVWSLLFVYFLVMTVNTLSILALGNGFITLAPSIVQFLCAWTVLVSTVCSLSLFTVDMCFKRSLREHPYAVILDEVCYRENPNIVMGIKIFYFSLGVYPAIYLAFITSCIAYGKYFFTLPGGGTALSFTTSVLGICSCLALCSIISLALFTQSTGCLLTDSVHMKNLEDLPGAFAAAYDQAEKLVSAYKQTAAVSSDTVLQTTPSSVVTCSENDTAVHVEAAVSSAWKK